MRVECPCGCGHRFDIPIRSILAEAERLRAKQKRPSGLVKDRQKYVRQRFTDLVERGVIPEPDGNVLSPEELEAKRLGETKSP